MSKAEASKEFKNALYIPQFRSYVFAKKTINYVSIGNDSLPLVVFVHGSPGSWSAFSDFMKDSSLLNNVRMISVDRPGFGYSDYGIAEPSLNKQAEALKQILSRHKNTQKLVLVGHSLGGPLIVKMAMLYPELIDKLIVVAGSVDPALEPKEWYRKPMSSKMVRWMLPGSIRASNEEILALESELKKMKQDWENITIPVTIIHGEQDNLVPVENAFYAKTMLKNATVELVIDKELNHFIPWKKPQLIREAILKSVIKK